MLRQSLKSSAKQEAGDWKSSTVKKGFPGGTSGKKKTKTKPSCPAGDIRDAGLIPGLGRSPREGNGNPLQYSWKEKPMDRAAWQTTVHRVAESDMTNAT